MLRILALTFISLGLALAAYGLLKPEPPVRAISTFPTGSEQPLPGATYANGYNVISYPGCDLQRTYAAAQVFTGPPVAAFDGRGQSFAFMRLVCDANDPAQRVHFDTLGMQAMRARGFVPLPDSEPHPAVRAFLIDAQQQGLGVGELFGRVISRPRCEGGRCRQYLDRVALEVGADGSGPVQFLPLGCELQLACARALVVEPEARSPLAGPLLWLLGGVALLSLGVALLVRQRLTGGNPLTIYTIDKVV